MLLYFSLPFIVTQTFTYYSRDVGTPTGCCLTVDQINQASCDIARRVAARRNTIVAGGIVQTAAYKSSRNKEEVHEELREGLAVLIKNDVDLIIVEVRRQLFTFRSIIFSINIFKEI